MPFAAPKLLIGHVPTGVNRDSQDAPDEESNALIRRRASQCIDGILVS